MQANQFADYLLLTQDIVSTSAKRTTVITGMQCWCLVPILVQQIFLSVYTDPAQLPKFLFIITYMYTGNAIATPHFASLVTTSQVCILTDNTALFHTTVVHPNTHKLLHVCKLSMVLHMLNQLHGCYHCQHALLFASHATVYRAIHDLDVAKDKGNAVPCSLA